MKKGRFEEKIQRKKPALFRKGKFEEKTPEAQAAESRKSLMKSYMTSLLALVLCATMLMGTTMAWFTSGVTSEGNEIYIGVLKIDLLQKGDNDTWNSLMPKEAGDEVPAILDKEMKWEPNATAYETLKVVNQGDLAFNYRLSFTLGENGAEMDSALLEKIAGQFTVYVRNETVQNGATPTFTKPESISEITADSNWQSVGTLHEVLTKSKPVFSGSMGLDEVGKDADGTLRQTEHIYSIALHMNKEANGEDIMGEMLKLNIKLEAYQMSAEEDAFGNDYDNGALVYEVSNTEELLEALRTAGEGAVIRMAEGTYTITQNEALKIETNKITLQGAGVGKTVIDAGATACSGQGALFISANDVTISDLTMKTGADNGSIAAIKVSALNNQTDIIKGVTLKNLVIEGKAGHGVNLHGVSGAKLDNLSITSYGKCGISMAKATNVTVTNTTTAKGGWADIGMMYSSTEGDLYNAPSSLTFDGTNSFGNNLIYSERPSTATGGVDQVNYPAGWVQTVADNGTWSCSVPASVSSKTELKEALEKGGNILVTEDISVDDGTAVKAGANINFNGNTLSRDTASGNPFMISTTEPVVLENAVFKSVKGSAVVATRTDGANITVKNSTFNNLASPSNANQ